MDRRLFFQGHGTGKSRLEGYNFGRYPIHNFRHINDPDPVYPLWASIFGTDEWRKECFRKRTFSDTFAVEYVQKGVFIFQQDNITMRVRPGGIFLVHQGRNNSMRCETAFALKRTIIMRGPQLKPILETLGLDRIHMIELNDRSRIDRLFARIDELAEDTTPAGRRDSTIACYSLLVELAEQAAVRHRPPELERALEYLQGHLNEPLRLAELVRHAGVSSATLHRQFRKYLKTAPIDYFLTQKLERAKSLLENHQYSIKEVAQMLNYASPQYFASEFRKKYGVPPKFFKYRITE